MLLSCRPKDDEHGNGGKIIAGMPMGSGPANGSHGTNGSSETEGLISGRKTSRQASFLAAQCNAGHLAATPYVGPVFA